MTSFAPQCLDDDLERSIAYYQKIGFSFDEPWDGLYAIGSLSGLEVHLKEAPKNEAERQWRRDNEHLDAAAGVDGIEAFYEQCVASGITIIRHNEMERECARSVATYQYPAGSKRDECASIRTA